MAKLYFRYGAMNSGKSTALMQVAHNYEEQGMQVLILKPQVDTKGGGELVSRLGVRRKADLLIPPEADIILWNDFLESGRAYTGSYRDDADSHGTSVILYSGGTTGVSKGICLSSYNFNALAKQIVSVNPGYRPGDRMLAVMPIFHGFGLGISIHTSLCQGGNCILVPRFTPDSYVKLMLKYRCNYIAGVPALFEALIRMPKMKKADLSFLKGVFSGGDSLSVELKRKMDRYLDEHNSPVQVREG